MTERVLRLPGARCCVGTVAGEPVVTGFGHTSDGHLGVFDIGTLPGHRGRRYGSAITARVVGDGFRKGAQGACLQSSPPRYGVYARLGFRKVEDWQLWISA